MHIPIIGNGDVVNPQIAKEMFDRYGVDAIMIGRATYGRPWIFSEIKHYLQTGTLMPALTIREKVDLAKIHLQKSFEIKGERVGIYEMRRHLTNYFKALPHFKEIRLKLVTLSDINELKELLEHIAQKYDGFVADSGQDGNPLLS